MPFAAGTKFLRKKKELRFSKLPVQVHWVPFYVVDQYLYRIESLPDLKQPPCNNF